MKFCRCYKEKDTAMSGSLEKNIKCWTAKRKFALVIEIVQAKTTMAKASRSYDLAPSEIEALLAEYIRRPVGVRQGRLQKALRPEAGLRFLPTEAPMHAQPGHPKDRTISA
jgi:hypothetical protein